MDAPWLFTSHREDWYRRHAIPHNDPQSRERCVNLGMNPMEERLELSFRLHGLWGLRNHVIGWARVAWRIVRQYLPHARSERQ